MKEEKKLSDINYNVTITPYHCVACNICLAVNLLYSLEQLQSISAARGCRVVGVGCGQTGLATMSCVFLLRL